MRKRTILLLPLLSVLLPLGAGHADSSSGAATQASQQPTYFWGVRQGCFLDGMVWDALHVRDAEGTVRRLSVPMSEDTKNCFGEACIKALRAGGCGNLNLSGGVWGGEVTEVPDQGGRVAKVRLWKTVPERNAIEEAVAIWKPTDKCFDHDCLARFVAQQMTDFGRFGLQPSSQKPFSKSFAELPECQPQEIRNQAPGPVPVSTIPVYFAASYQSDADKTDADTWAKTHGTPSNLIYRANKGGIHAKKLNAPVEPVAKVRLTALFKLAAEAAREQQLSDLRKLHLLIVHFGGPAPLADSASTAAASSTSPALCRYWYEVDIADTGVTGKPLGSTQCGSLEELTKGNFLKPPALGGGIKPPVVTKRRVPDWCMTPMSTCERSVESPTQVPLLSDADKRYRWLDRGGRVAIAGTVLGGATMLALGSANLGYHLESTPENPAWRSPSNVLAAGFWTATGLTVAFAASSAAIIGFDYAKHKERLQDELAKFCPFLLEVRP